MKAILNAILLGTLIFCNRLLAADIYATGGWTEVIDASDLVSGAGSDLNSQYESASDATTIDIENAEFYNVYVRKSDSNWHPSLALYIRRTGSGSGGGSVSGGLTYRQVSDADTYFFQGYLPRTGITARYKMTGLSISIPPDTYSTTVILTIIET